jgi:hypothetical protein
LSCKRRDISSPVPYVHFQMPEPPEVSATEPPRRSVMTAAFDSCDTRNFRVVFSLPATSMKAAPERLFQTSYSLMSSDGVIVNPALIAPYGSSDVTPDVGALANGSVGVVPLAGPRKMSPSIQTTACELSA